MPPCGGPPGAPGVMICAPGGGGGGQVLHFFLCHDSQPHSEHAITAIDDKRYIAVFMSGGPSRGIRPLDCRVGQRTFPRPLHANWATNRVPIRRACRLGGLGGLPMIHY